MFSSRDGEPVRIEHPGRWNLEAGPDFLGSVLVIGTHRRRIVTDTEIHVHPHDWLRHGHGKDPRYARVGCHVTWFEHVLSPDRLPAGCIQMALRPIMSVWPGFSFEAIDVSVYPYGARAPVPPCFRILRDWSPHQKRALLATAGEERLRRKAERLAARIRERGADQTLYEEFMAGLGYKHNKRPFRQLAETIPIDTLRRHSDGDPIIGYALLLGAAGLLPEHIDPAWDAETRSFVHRLWKLWWKHRTGKPADTPPAERWRFDGMRPANHPARRLMAAALLVVQQSGPAELCTGWAAQHPAHWPGTAVSALTALSDPYWSHRTGWNAPRRPGTIALIGKARATSLLLNVVLPFLAGNRRFSRAVRAALEALPPEPDNGIIRQAATNLFGPDHPPSFYRNALRTQGLIQIFQDFCLNDRAQCATCPLPKALAASSSGKTKVHTA